MVGQQLVAKSNWRTTVGGVQQKAASLESSNSITSPWPSASQSRNLR